MFEYIDKKTRNFREFMERNITQESDREFLEGLKKLDKRVRNIYGTTKVFKNERQKIQYLAQQSLHIETRSGRIKKQPCKVCGKKKVHAHHEDYSRPLDVVWFCPKHHSMRHIELRKITERLEFQNWKLLEIKK